MQKTYQGSCVCGSVKFECELDLAKGTTRCNCSFCKKARFWMAFTGNQNFRLLEGAQALRSFQRTPPGKPGPFLDFQFCGNCGVRAFTKGGALPQFGGEFHAVNIACLDNATDEELAQAPVHYADGRNDHWETASTATRYL